MADAATKDEVDGNKTRGDSVDMDPGRSIETDYNFYDAENNFQPHTFALYLKDEYGFITFEDTDTIWCYQDGVYKDNGSSIIRQELVDELTNDFSPHKMDKVKEILKGMTTVKRQHFGAPKRYINVENGVYDLQEDELLPHGPDKMFMSKIPVRYDPDADCPKIKEFIRDVVDDSDVDLIQEMIGVCLYRGYPLEKAFMMLGDGQNGKSTFTNLLNEFLGRENVSAKGLRELLSEENKRAEVEDKLMNADPDVSNQVLEHSKEFKRLTGSDTVSARKLYSDPIEFENHATLIFGANELPRTRDTNYAFWRRWILIDFPYRFTNIEGDGYKDLDSNVLDDITTDEELSGLFNWAVKGLRRVLDNEAFSTEGNSEDVKERWVQQSDTLTAFLENKCRVEPGEEMLVNKFYRLYCKYCDERDMTPHDESVMGKRIQKIMPHVEKRRRRDNGVRNHYYVNVAVDEEHIDVDGDEDGAGSDEEELLHTVREMDDGDGVLKEEVIEAVDVDGAEDLIEECLGKGKLFEPHADKVKVL